MRYQRFKRIIILFLSLFGMLALTVAFFAFQLHLDNNAIMGPSRRVLALLGVLSLGLALWIAFSSQIRNSRFSLTLHRLVDSLRNSRISTWLRACHTRYMRSSFHLFLSKHSWLFPVLAAAIVIFIYFFYITGAKWAFTDYSQYYDMLANAFLKGSLALLEKPPAALAALANPYDYGNREGIHYLWDASYFQGNYYLYWGPVPALFAALFKSIHPVVIEDQVLVFLFLSGLAIVIAATFHHLRSTFFPSAPGWTAGFFTLVTMLSLPLIWIVNRAMVYEAAIASAQFFLILGLYAALRALTSPRKSAWLVLAGFAWGAAVNSRVSLGLVVFILALILVLFLLFTIKKPSSWIPPTIALVLPLVISASAFAAYNFARFGAFLQTGHKYQLTGIGMPEDYSDLTSIAYIIPNLYRYLGRSFDINLDQFPFIFIPYIDDSVWPWFIPKPPGMYAAKQLSGIFRTIPFLWLLSLPVFRFGSILLSRINESPVQNSKNKSSLLWIWVIIIGASLILITSISIFVAANMRYLVDIVPILCILTGLCIWWFMYSVEKQTHKISMILLLCILLGGLTIIFGLLSGFAVIPYRFRDINPSLFSSIAHFFSSVIQFFR